jgi:hypothetical protein
MRTVRMGAPTTPDQVVADILQAEFHSTRWGPFVAMGLELQLADPSIVTQPDVTDPEENECRSRVYAAYRGWPKNPPLYDGFPGDEIEWRHATLEPRDGPRLHYLDTVEWAAISQGTARAEVAAASISAGTVPRGMPWDPVDSITAIAERLRRGESLPRCVLFGSPEREGIAILEGHARLTAHLMVGLPAELPVLYGSGPQERLSAWRFYPVPLR